MNLNTRFFDLRNMQGPCAHIRRVEVAGEQRAQELLFAILHGSRHWSEDLHYLSYASHSLPLQHLYFFKDLGV